MTSQKSSQDNRKARLAEQLRANLRKRKAQAREVAVAGDEAGSSDWTTEAEVRPS